MELAAVFLFSGELVILVGLFVYEVLQPGLSQTVFHRPYRAVGFGGVKKVVTYSEHIDPVTVPLKDIGSHLHSP